MAAPIFNLAKYVKSDVWPRGEIQRQIEALGNSKETKVDKAILVLLHDEDIDGVYYDTIAGREVVGKAPWRGILHDSQYWTDNDTKCFCTFCSQRYHFRPSTSAADEALRACTTDGTNGRMVNPLRAYFDGLRGTWDGEQRLRSILYDVCGTPKTDYTEEVLRIFLMGAISRAYHPGAKFDSVLTLYGPQGSGKSSFSELLPPGDGDFYAALDFSMMEDSKIMGERIQGKMVVELEEMGGLRKTSQRKVKSGISRKADRYRDAYGHRGEDHQRTCVFVATVNPEDGKGILTDPTGNRRYLPIEAPGRGLTHDKIKEIMDSQRDQLWAEALVYFDFGGCPVLSQKSEAEAERRRQELLDVDRDLAGTIRDYLLMPLSCTQRQWYESKDLSAMRTEWKSWRRMDDETREKILPAVDKMDGRKRYPREYACVSEIWMVALGNDKEPDRRDSQAITTLLASGQVSGWSYDRKGCKVCGDWGRKPPILPQ